MAIKIKQKEGLKIIARCSNPHELMWFMNTLATMRSDGRRTPITSVQNLKGEEIQVLPQPTPQTVTIPPPTGVTPQTVPSQLVQMPVQLVKAEAKKDGKEGQQPVQSVVEGQKG